MAHRNFAKHGVATDTPGGKTFHRKLAHVVSKHFASFLPECKDDAEDTRRAGADVIHHDSSFSRVQYCDGIQWEEYIRDTYRTAL